MFRISGPQLNPPETTNAKSIDGRGSRSSNVRTTNVGTAKAETAQGGPKAPESFASLLQVWDPFTGQHYAEGQAPKVALNTRDSGAPAVAAASPGIRPESAFTPQGVPESIRLDAVSVDSVSYNSARSVTASNASYNRNAVDAHEYQLENWKDNNGRRWLNGQWMQTEIPPPPPILKETVFDNVLARMRSGQLDTTPIPYYMGNQHAGQIYEYNAPLNHDGENTTTYAVDANGQPMGGAIATPQGQQFASNVSGVIGKPRIA